MYQTFATSFLQFRIYFFSYLLNWTPVVWMQKNGLSSQSAKTVTNSCHISLPNSDSKFHFSLGYDRPGSIHICHGSCWCEYTDIVELLATFICDSEMEMMAAQSAAKLFCNVISLISRSQVRLG